MKKNSNIEILFIFPYFIFFIIFLLIPTVSGIFLSFTDYTGYSLKDIKFIGLENYLNLFNVNSIYFEDFWYSILRTSLFVLLSTPFLIGVPLIFAAMINTLPEKIRNVYRVIFYIPSLFSVSAIGLLGVWFFEQEYGLVNYFLDSFLSDKLPWVSEGSLGWIAILLLTIWWTIGGNLVIYLAGLKNISKELYEAAELDGANWFQQLLNITLPGLKNQIMFTSIMTVLASFNLYGQPAVLTGGGPGRDTTTITMYIREIGFGTSGTAGQAASMAIVFGAIMMLFSIVQYKLQTKQEA